MGGSKGCWWVRGERVMRMTVPGAIALFPVRGGQQDGGDGAEGAVGMLDAAAPT
jgi:hypothetical protein